MIKAFPLSFMAISIIIPVLNESRILPETLAPLSDLTHEIVVVDGGSTDGTVQIAAQYTPHVLNARHGRGFQLHRGALQSKGDVLLFLHADTSLPQGFDKLIEEALAEPSVMLGAFRLGFYPSSAWLRLVALVANLRSCIFHLPYGDQALFVRRADYFKLGGFQDLPIMEDVDLVVRFTRHGRLKMVHGEVMTSSRRWQKEGFLYTTLRNWSLLLRYLFGMDPHRLTRFYSDTR